MIPKPRLMGNQPSGHWRVVVYPSGLRSGESAVDVTFVRGAPTQVTQLGTSDPFGPTTASLIFPSITALDRLGAGDIAWCSPDVDVDVCWVDAASGEVTYRWEGYFASFDIEVSDSESSLNVTCRGAMFQLDHYLAKPEYVYQPIPYEVSIARSFGLMSDSRMSGLSVRWPSWWSKTFTLADYSDKPLYMRPVGVEDGANWSGFVTRSTGTFDNALTGYVQGLLANMYTEYGQFTLALEEGRTPVLRHRDRVTQVQDDTLIVDVLQPGVSMSFTRDFTQQLNVVYGQGKSINGSTFSGMKMSADGTRITYEPFAFRREVFPVDENDWWTRNVMRKEVNLSFYEGVNEVDAKQIALDHLHRFSDPGFTGSITLSSDAEIVAPEGSSYVPFELITAGRSILVKGLAGREDGVLFHITESSISEEGADLTVDSKYRDQLTVQEVRMRTRDSLAPIRLLTVGQYKPNIPDMLFPWSYTDGSGFGPKGSINLFDGMPNNVTFPWTEWTTQRPPKDPQWTGAYAHIGPASDNADHNWANSRTSLDDFAAIPIRMSQAGEVSLIQVAAFDRDGQLLQVPFHVSFYKTNGTSYTSMPMLGMDDEEANPPYKSGQHYPFFERAWEEFDAEGKKLNPETVQVVPTAQILVGYGNYYEKAGFWPSSSTMPGATPTGMFSDQGGWSWDLTDAVYGVDPQRSREENLADPNRADIQMMIYCDGQGTQDVYFLCRIYRKEPGTA